MAVKSDVEVDLVRLHQLISEHFSIAELAELCFSLGVEPENIPGVTRDERAREAIKRFYRLGRIADLLRQCQTMRDHVDWSPVRKIRQAAETPEAWVDPMQYWLRLVKSFNRNRGQVLSDERTADAEEIAYQMREAAPYVFGLFDIPAWLKSSSPGKRLAAIKYLDWLQDSEYLTTLLRKLLIERPFIQLHALVAIDSMMDQAEGARRAALQVVTRAYKFIGNDPDREYWRKRIIQRLRDRNKRQGTA